jgi:hypothetical protein
LAGSGEHAVGLYQELTPRDGNRPAAAAVVRLPQTDLHALKTNCSVPLCHHPRGSHQEPERNSLCLCGPDLLAAGRHLFAIATVENPYGLGAHPQRRPAGLHSCGSPADDHDPWPRSAAIPVVDTPEKRESIFDQRASRFARHAQEATPLSSDGKNRRFVTTLQQGFQLHIHSETLAGPDIHSGPDQYIDLRIKDVPGQTIRGDSVAEHPARFSLRLEDRHTVSGEPEVVGRGQACGTGADDGDPFGTLERGRWSICRELTLQVGDKPFERTDGNRFINATTPTCILAGMVAHTTADPGQRASPADDLERLVKTFLGPLRRRGWRRRASNKLIGVLQFAGVPARSPVRFARVVNAIRPTSEGEGRTTSPFSIGDESWEEDER